jgi:cobalt-zinc-cadmium efflux system outer membrane protein
MNSKLQKKPWARFLHYFSAFLFCIYLSLVHAETKLYDLPAAPNILEQRVELVEPQGFLSLTGALSLALLHNPVLQDYAWSIRIADIETLRASLLPKPEIEIEAENFLGSEQQSDFDLIETTLSISQLFELGGKAAKREALANKQRDLVLWDYEAKRLDIIYQLATRYIEVLAGQQRFKLATEASVVAEEIYNTTVARVNAGKVSPLEQSKSGVELAKTRLNKVRIEARLVSKKQKLAAVWGSLIPRFKEVAGDLFAV